MFEINHGTFNMRLISKDVQMHVLLGVAEHGDSNNTCTYQRERAWLNANDSQTILKMIVLNANSYSCKHEDRKKDAVPNISGSALKK